LSSLILSSPLRGEDQGEGEKISMSDLAFGLTMMVAGMGVTFLTLYLLTLLIRLLTRLFPFKKEG
jgi:hypothetical protein